ncbi:hypothetical protein Tco_0201337 [Tanacetum coccineum]
MALGITSVSMMVSDASRDLLEVHGCTIPSASLGNTSSDPSEDSSKDRSASLTISPFHDDLYMKVMQAYNVTNNESPIPLPRAPIAPPPVLPSYPLLPPSPLFDLEISFFPRRLCHLRNKPVSYHPPLLILLPHLMYLRLERVLM